MSDIALRVGAGGELFTPPGYDEIFRALAGPSTSALSTPTKAITNSDSRRAAASALLSSRKKGSMNSGEFRSAWRLLRATFKEPLLATRYSDRIDSNLLSPLIQ